MFIPIIPGVVAININPHKYKLPHILRDYYFSKTPGCLQSHCNCRVVPFQKVGYTFFFLPYYAIKFYILPYLSIKSVLNVHISIYTLKK